MKKLIILIVLLFVSSCAYASNKVFDLLNVNGALEVKATSTSSNFTLDDEVVLLVDASSGDITVTLPAASTNTDRVYFIKKTDSSVNSVIVDGNGSETVDGETTQELISQYDSITIICDGSNWFII